MRGGGGLGATNIQNITSNLRSGQSDRLSLVSRASMCLGSLFTSEVAGSILSDNTV